MASNPPRATLPSDPDDIARLAVSRTLSIGLLASVAVMVVGSIVLALSGRSVSSSVVALDRVLPDLSHGSKPALLDSGILILFATPLVGVVVACLHFIRLRDRAFSVITLALLFVLAAGFIVALH